MVMRGPQDPTRPLSKVRQKRMQQAFLARGARGCEWCEDLAHRREIPLCPVCRRPHVVEKLKGAHEGILTRSALGAAVLPG